MNGLEEILYASGIFLWIAVIVGGFAFYLYKADEKKEQERSYMESNIKREVLFEVRQDTNKMEKNTTEGIEKLERKVGELEWTLARMRIEKNPPTVIEIKKDKR